MQIAIAALARVKMFTVETNFLLVLPLLSLSAVQGGDWGVNYPPQEMCALRGSSVVIPCTYDYPESFEGTVLTVKWFRSSSPGITDRDTYVYHSTGINVSPEYKNRTEYLGKEVKNCTLQIRDLQSNDTDRYYFRFETTQPAGKWTGVTGVSLSITEPKLTLDPPVPDHTVKEGSFITLTCSFDRCTLSESSFVWYREGQPISNEKSNKLQFNVSYEHSGKYCCASAENSSFKSEEINLIVKYSPKNTSASDRAPGGIAEGSSVTLTCTSNANPPVSSYTWFRRDGNGDEEKARQQHLNFSSITSSDSGDYYCEANNSLGAQNSSSVHLSVTAIMRMDMLIYAVAGSVPVIILLILVIIICIKRNQKDQPIEKVNVKSEGGNQELTVINTIYENVNGLPSSRGTQEHVEEIHYGSIQFQERNQPHTPIDDKNIPLEDSVIYSTVAKPVS